MLHRSLPLVAHRLRLRGARRGEATEGRSDRSKRPTFSPGSTGRGPAGTGWTVRPRRYRWSLIAKHTADHDDRDGASDLEFPDEHAARSAPTSRLSNHSRGIYPAGGDGRWARCLRRHLLHAGFGMSGGSRSSATRTLASATTIIQGAGGADRRTAPTPPPLFRSHRGSLRPFLQACPGRV